jgi:hypothetical protein
MKLKHMKKILLCFLMLTLASVCWAADKSEQKGSPSIGEKNKKPKFTLEQLYSFFVRNTKVPLSDDYLQIYKRMKCLAVAQNNEHMQKYSRLSQHDQAHFSQEKGKTFADLKNILIKKITSEEDLIHFNLGILLTNNYEGTFKDLDRLKVERSVGQILYLISEANRLKIQIPASDI